MNIAMAQSLSFFGNRRGSTKSHTYQVNGGQQITKDRVDEVKNPRSTAQMVHRCCLHTLSDAHAFLRPFIGGFWEGARSPQAALAAFRKANYPLLRGAASSESSAFNFSPYKETTKPIGLYQISNGSLVNSKFKWVVKSASRVRPEVCVDGEVDYFGTVAQVFDFFDIHLGDVLVFVLYAKQTTKSLQGAIVVELKVKLIDDSLFLDHSVSDFYDVIRVYNPLGFNWNISPTGVGGIRLSDSFNFYSSSYTYGAAFQMRYVNSRLRIMSSCLRKVSQSSLPLTFAEAIATYPQGGGNVLDGGAI